MEVFKKTTASLEFDRILNEAARYTSSPPGASLIRALRPLASAADIQDRFEAISELRLLSDQDTPLVLGRFEDIEPFLNMLRPVGSLLEGKELLVFIPVLSNMETVVSTLEERGQELPALSEKLATLSGFPGLLSDLEKSIGGEGEILDTASPELKKLRQTLRRLDTKISRRLGEITREPEVETFLQDDFVTKRSGRWVIPVRMDSKGMVKGVVHDVSRSGETAFMEPLEIIGLSNELENLSADVKTEEIRVLKRLSAQVRESSELLLSEFQLLVELDMLLALSALSHKLKSENPSIGEAGRLRLLSARHPLLMLMSSQSVVPLDIELSEGSSVMVITGPNAGGKTISIKTVGLLMLMASSGIPVPARSESVLPLADSLLVDIGDEQSIEESLSTFTAHATRIAGIVKDAAPGSLILLDELGTGTDPLQGSAIGCGVLSELNKRGSLVVATTHLTDIVAYVHKTSGMTNASMEFDQKTMQPLYRLVPGEPGQSHAIEAAERSGMPKEVIEFARKMAGSERLELEEMLSELKRARARYEAELSAIEGERAALERERLTLEARLSEMEQNRKKELKRALEDARQEAAEVKRGIRALMDEAKVAKKTRTALKGVEGTVRELDARIDDLGEEDEFEPIEPGEIRQGARVFVKTLDRDAEVASVDAGKGRVSVRIGQKELSVPISSVGAPRDARKERQTGRGTVTVPGNAVSDLNIETEIKLIGLRVDEAMEKLEPFLNRTSLAGVASVRVIHGIGTGALRKAVKEHLKGHPLVEGFMDAPTEQGGAGATIVRLK
jgi:DNA mismatch repair protein MutS2